MIFVLKNKTTGKYLARGGELVFAVSNVFDGSDSETYEVEELDAFPDETMLEVEPPPLPELLKQRFDSFSLLTRHKLLQGFKSALDAMAFGDRELARYSLEQIDLSGESNAVKAAQTDLLALFDNAGGT